MADADDIRFIPLVNAHLDFPDILNYLCANLELQAADLDVERQSRLLLDALAAQARRNQVAVLLIDDAHHLSVDVLLRLQALVETPAIPSQRLQVVLAGLPEIADKLEQPALRQLRDSIRVRCHLERLSELETGLFIDHQFRVAGRQGGELLSPAAVERIGAYCKGVPRAIAILCDTIFLFASLQLERFITPELVDDAAKTCFLGELSRLATQTGEDRPGGADIAETLPVTPGEHANLDLDLSEFDFSFDFNEQAMSTKQPATMPSVGMATQGATVVPPVVTSAEAHAATAAERLIETRSFETASLDSSPLTDPCMDAEDMESRPAELSFGAGIAWIEATDSHVEERNKLNALGDSRSAPEKYSWLTRFLSPITQQESPMSRLDNLNKILKNLQNESPGVEASALISEDGLMLASALSQDLDQTRVAGMTATLLNLGTRAATELRRGDVQEIIVRGEHGYAVMISAGRGALLLVLTNENTKLGLIFFDMREAIKAIKNIL